MASLVGDLAARTRRRGQGLLQRPLRLGILAFVEQEVGVEVVGIDPVWIGGQSLLEIGARLILVAEADGEAGD